VQSRLFRQTARRLCCCSYVPVHFHPFRRVPTECNRTLCGVNWSSPPSGDSRQGVRRVYRVADHSPPSSAEEKNTCNYTFTSLYVFIAWCLFSTGSNLLRPSRNWTKKNTSEVSNNIRVLTPRSACAVIRNILVSQS
jgi:hypothetical protein